MASLGLSAVISTYGGDRAEELALALTSIFHQTRQPDEVILVKDGPVPSDNSRIINLFENHYPTILEVHALSENVGQAVARQVGVNVATHPIIAIMDADDVCVPKRFECQLKYLAQNPEVDVVGSFISEFETNPENPHAVREVPVTHEEIVRMARHRSPINQSTVMFRRKAIISAGNYRDVDHLEDYGLWVRLILDGAQFANIPKPLVAARAGKAMYGRRGGWSYAREELRFQYECWRWGFLSLPTMLLNLAIRVPIRFVPNSIRGKIYRRYFRKQT